MKIATLVGLITILSIAHCQTPTKFSWADYNETSFVPQVQNQNFPSACNSGWAFSAIDVLNSRAKIRRKAQSPDISLSTHVLLACDTYDYGCMGGEPLSAFKWISQNNITDSSCHSYVAAGYTNGYGCSSLAKCQSCQGGLCKPVGNSKIYSIMDLDYGSVAGQDDMMKQILAYGPIACGINVQGLTNYTSGIITQSSNNSTRINHYVTVYGWDQADGVKYWRVKNSWGPAWGEKGHFRVEKGKNVIQIEKRCIWGSPMDTWADDIRNKTLPNQIKGDNIAVQEQETGYNTTNLQIRKYLVPTKSSESPNTCQASAAFAVIHMLADRQSILSKGKSPVTLSVQALLNCGGDTCTKETSPFDILTFIQKYGLPEQGCQNYKGMSPAKASCTTINNCALCTGSIFNPKCTAINNYKRWKVTHYESISGVQKMKQQIIEGPIVCGIQMSKTFKEYKGGIFSEITIAPKVDYYVEIISYGSQGGKNYWVGRNPVSTSWGQSSFFQIQAGKNTLGIQSKCYFASGLL